MSNIHQPLDGPNGAYSVCHTCGNRYGTPPQGGIGMWYAVCAICGEYAPVANALHDWNITDGQIRRLCEQKEKV